MWGVGDLFFFDFFRRMEGIGKGTIFLFLSLRFKGNGFFLVLFIESFMCGFCIWRKVGLGDLGFFINFV